MRTTIRIVFSGMMAGDPYQGGATWAVLQYVLGFQRLGHHVLFVEPVAPSSIRPAGAALADSDNAAYFRQTVRDFGLEDQAALMLAGSRESFGLAYEEVCRLATGAELLVNVAGMLTDPELVAAISTRVYLDLDPGFVQLWHTTQGVDMHFDGHTHFVTVGQRIGRSGCDVPTCGQDWRTTLQPVVLERWPQVTSAPEYGLTTVSNWRGYGSFTHDGKYYGQKAHSWRQVMELPQRLNERFQPALAIHPEEIKDLAALTDGGWQWLDARAVAATPQDYQRFIQGSMAELAVAKSGYVAAECGWFSDRSACYLASGRPVIAQDTAFSPPLPVGEGLLSFKDSDDVVAAVETLRANYARHATAARWIAEDYFDSDYVLKRFLQQVDGA